jgi:hypothetical protein
MKCPCRKFLQLTGPTPAPPDNPSGQAGFPQLLTGGPILPREGALRYCALGQ